MYHYQRIGFEQVNIPLEYAKCFASYFALNEKVLKER